MLRPGLVQRMCELEILRYSRRCDHHDLDRAALVRRWGLEQTRWVIFLGSARNGPASLKPPYDHAPSRTAASSSLGGEELRLVIPVLESVCECDVPVRNVGCKESSMGRGILLWLLGVPIPIIIRSCCSGTRRRTAANPVTGVGVVSSPTGCRRDSSRSATSWGAVVAGRVAAAAATLVLMCSGCRPCLAATSPAVYARNGSTCISTSTPPVALRSSTASWVPTR